MPFMSNIKGCVIKSDAFEQWHSDTYDRFFCYSELLRGLFAGEFCEIVLHRGVTPLGRAGMLVPYLAVFIDNQRTRQASSRQDW